MIEKKDKVYGKNIVLIGGDINFVNSLERILFFAGANVSAFMSGQKGAIESVNLRPDAIVIESSFSDISINDLIDTIAKNELTKSIPILVIASESNINIYKKIFSSVNDYVCKDNLDMVDLIEKIGLLLKDTNQNSPDQIFDFSESESNIQNANVAPHLKLLVIEDDSLLRNLLSIRLQKSDIQFDFCASGNDALSSILEYKPTVLILDLMLPGKDGMEILSDIRNSPQISNLPVIIFSNRDDDRDRQKAKELGVEVFLTKVTTDLSELVSHVIELGKPTK